MSTRKHLALNSESSSLNGEAGDFELIRPGHPKVDEFIMEMTAGIQSGASSIFLSHQPPYLVPGHSTASLPAPRSSCAVCQKTFPASSIVVIKQLKPRFARSLQIHYPHQKFLPETTICIQDVFAAINVRIDKLLEEDASQFSKLQDDAMRNLLVYELEEETWQAQFESGRTFGQRAADLIARFGGSWRFILMLLGSLAFWAMLNLILQDKAWDPYPFILLNLFLSSLAALQAPIIMMSQNRQDQRDRSESNFISKIILRSENQIRHANAKVDFLMSFQWKRLLEIQEIQIGLLETLQKDPGIRGSVPQSNHKNFTKSFQWNVEAQPDPHLQLLLTHYFEMDTSDHTMIFSRWHSEGDNYLGYIDRVQLEVRKDLRLKKLTYEIDFKDASANLDDIFSGANVVTFRNDFDVPHMKVAGRILKISITLASKATHTFLNGDLPPRYKTTFAPTARINRISEFWTQPIQKIVLSYSPPYISPVLDLKKGQILKSIEAHFFQCTHRTQTAKLFMLANPTDANSYLNQVTNALTLSTTSHSDAWTYLLEHSWTEIAQVQWGKEELNSESIQQDIGFRSFDIQREFRTGRWVFLCVEARIVLHGEIENDGLYTVSDEDVSLPSETDVVTAARVGSGGAAEEIPGNAAIRVSDDERKVQFDVVAAE